ncbi:MFS transporter [Alteribacter lacisalsi]|uniref:MFS transporter n=1 Tax=Alteribacter lacisalsi TaxID=2045244 RepID=A0A2W0H9F3_9BACI|nr:MFS transporter [Alteribacter lacisalsi]PYZ97757.1 MFS transporter [Alteribacter lacisalsi]
MTDTKEQKEAPRIDPKLKSRLILLICAILTFTVMNGTMFNVAIPDIAEHFGLMPSQVSWVMTGYILVFSIGSLMYGKLADIFPIKNLLTFGLTLFFIGATLGILAPNYPTLLAARIIQALGGATIPALAFIIPARFIPDERGRVFGIVSATVAFASGLGPIAGGLIGGFLSWRFLFLFSMLSIVAIPFLRKWIPDEERRHGVVDIPGAVFIAASVASLLVFITTGLWWAPLMFATSLILFIWRTLTAEHPFIEPSLLKDGRYTTTVATSFLGTSVLFGMIFIIPIMLRDLYDLNTLAIGLVLFPGAMAAGLIGQAGGRLVDRKGSVPVVKLAMILVGFGTVLISTFAGFHPVVVALCVLVTYLGFPLVQSSTANLLSSIVPEKQTGVGIGMFNLLNFMSAAIGSAVYGRILDLETASFLLNPFARTNDNIIYSNLFLSLTGIALIALTIFLFRFRAGATTAVQKG